MDHMQSNTKRNLYFPQRLTKAMSKILDYPLTLVEAPMGYGKTTAVREHVARTGADLLWQNVYYDSKAAFWSGFCFLLKKLDHDRAQSLEQLGFPDDSVSIHAALKIILNITFSERTVIVIDDFHLVDTQEVTSFITLLAAHKIANLNIVLISRFYEYFDTPELSLKNLLYHITKKSFEFSQKEIIVYYQCCGINITASEANELFSLTEGWISALYLLMLNFKESGSLLTSINIHKLIEQAVYEPFSDTIKKFLLTMSIYNSFTPEQVSYMMPDVQLEEIEAIINEVTGKNAFVTYDPLKNSCHIHSIFKDFLANKLKYLHGPFQEGLYKRAAAWCMQAGDYLMSMRFSYFCGDFDALLGALELDRGLSISNEHKDVLIKYFDGCCPEDKMKHPYAVLIYAWRMFMFNETTLFKENCETFMEIYQNIESDDTSYKSSLLGEYQLLMGLAQYNDIEKMSEYHKQASELLNTPSLILDNRSSWTYGAPSVLYLFYRKSGELLKEVHMMQETMPYYYRVTGDHGKGADEIMIAERFYYMGDFQNAEICMHKAYQAAAETSDIMLCIIFLNIKLSFIKGDYADIIAQFIRLRDNIFENKRPMLIHTIDVCEAYIFSCLQMSEKVAPWINSGEFRNTRLAFPSLAYLDIVYGKVLLENDEYIKLLGRAERFLEMAGIYPNLLPQIYAYIYIAVASMKLLRADDAIAALKQALCIATPDKVYMPFVENGDELQPLLEELWAMGLYANDIPAILGLCRQYHNAKRRMIRKSSVQGKAALTERETEIARLAAQGLSNSEIGKGLYISENTVKTQLKSIFSKLGINSRALLKQELDN